MLGPPVRRQVKPKHISFRLKPSGINKVETKEKSRFARKESLVKTGFITTINTATLDRLDTHVFISSLIKIKCVTDASETSLITLPSVRKH